MNKHALAFALTLTSYAFAQPSYFSETSIRDDVAKRVGAFEINCQTIQHSIIESRDANCLATDRSEYYVKAIVDAYYSNYLRGGWKSYSSWISNTIIKDGRGFEISIFSKAGVTILQVYNSSASYERTKAQQASAQAKQQAAAAAQAQKALNDAGATPDASYVRVMDLKAFASVQASGGKYTMSLNKITLIFSLKSRAAILNGKAAQLNATPFLVDGVTYFPLAALKMFNCTYYSFDNVIIRCPSFTESESHVFMDSYTFKSTNPPSGQLVFQSVPVPQVATSWPARGSTASTATTAPPAAAQSTIVQSTNKPAPADQAPAVPFGAVENLASLGNLNYVSGGSIELDLGKVSISFKDGVDVTPEGIKLQGMPYMTPEGQLAVPLSSLQKLGCAVLVKDKQFAVTCPNGNTAQGPVTNW